MKPKSKNFLVYALLVITALALSLFARDVEPIKDVFSSMPEGLYLGLAILFIVGYFLNTLAPRTAIPSFVWAIFFGMALQPIFVLFTSESNVLYIVVELLAALVLFGGGVEIPFKNFRKQFAPIAMISLAGTLLTVFIFSLTLEGIGSLMGLSIPSIAFLLMGAILASIDPTAIIPSLKQLHFKKPELKDFAVSESAINDVVGTIITRFFLVVSISAGGASVIQLFGPFFRRQTFDALALEVIWGLAVGVFGAWVLRKWSKRKQREVDPALFFAVPILVFALGSIVGGSGFLAAFVAGLLFNTNTKTKHVRHYFETFVDGFIKPIIFVLLGAVVPIPILLSTAGIGIVSALVFMFAIRPLVVFVSLAPWALSKRRSFSVRELLFLSFIRETGAIPAVLILVAVSSNVVASEYIFAIGMWVILLTLLVEPPLTPVIARRLKVAD